jgi:hypothetical protein
MTKHSNNDNTNNKSCSSSNTNHNNNTRRRDPRRRKNDLVMVGIPFLIVQLFLLRAHVLSSTSSTAPTIIEVDHSPDSQHLRNERVESSHSFLKNLPSENSKNRTPDGFFNGYPVYYHDTTHNDIHPNDMDNRTTTTSNHYSQIQCVGEFYSQPQLSRKAKKNLNNTIDFAWMHRSCHFSLLCLDMVARDYVLFQDPRERTIVRKSSRLRPTVDVTQTYLVDQTPANQYPTGVSLGGINLKWTLDGGIRRLKWYPRIISGPLPPQYYTLPPNVIMVPFHSLAAYNPGHLVLDDFLPVYTLLDMFQLLLLPQDHDPHESEQSQPDLLLMRHVLPGERGLWASCDFRKDRSEECNRMHKKFQSLLLRNPHTKITTQQTFEFQPIRTTTASSIQQKQQAPQLESSSSSFQSNSLLSSNLICAKDGLAGIGALTDHGTRKIHGWESADYQVSHNSGRGGLFWRFRNYMMNNLGIPNDRNNILHPIPTMTTTTTPRMPSFSKNTNMTTTTTTTALGPPYKIVFSLHSSKTRHIDLAPEAEFVRTNISPDLATVETHIFWKQSLKQQVTIASQTAIYITGCGGGAVTSIFLPRGASLFILYESSGGYSMNQRTGLPARLDWDFFNHLNYIRVHWIPERSYRGGGDMNSLLELIQHELKIIQREISSP